jgi:diguanylate cyclase (GGDEF)-like protein/PAS domain S-box-containing protein
MSDSRIIDANNEQSTLTGYSIQEVLGKNMLDLNLWVQPQDRASYIDELIRHGAVNQREFVFRRGDGRMFVGLTSGRLIHIEDQQHVVTSILDITGRKEMEQKMQAVLAEKDAQYQTLSQIQDQLLKMNGELERLSAQDKLTGYFNRHKLTEMLEHEIFRWSRYGHSSTLVLVDIDHFKQINDRFGHLAGDKVLVDLSALLQANVRKTDLCFRWGGEEFLFLLTETEYLQAMRTAEKLRRVVETCSDFPVGSLTISLGVVTWREGWSYEEWIQQADQALYEAKEQGRNRVVGKTPQE